MADSGIQGIQAIQDTQDIQVRLRGALARILDLTVNQRMSVIVDSPPGAGKTELIVSVVWVLALRKKLRVAVVAPRVSQVYDLCRRLGSVGPPLSIQVLLASDRALPTDLSSNPVMLEPVSRARDIDPRARVVVGTVSKFFSALPDFSAGEFELLCCEEAYMSAYKDLAPLLKLGRTVMLVGDPGQLAPLVRVDTGPFESMETKVHWAAPRQLRLSFPWVPVVSLPASRRLCRDTVSIVQPAFYTSLPFVSAAPDATRRISFSAPSSGDAIDRALDLSAEGASIVALLLPGREVSSGGVDLEVATLMAEVATRVLARGAEWTGRRRIEPSHIGVMDAHVAGGASVRRALRALDISTEEVLVDTPERFQGLERLLTVVKHPMSGKRALSAFDLAADRWCVMLTRHLLCCLIIGREGIRETLEAHSHDCGERPLGAEDALWQGWFTHSTLWAELERLGRVVRM